MLLKAIVEEDFSNYKLPAMLLGFGVCSFKCDHDCGERVCQNSALAQSPDVEVNIDTIVDHYMRNPITAAICCGGLEPFDSFTDLCSLVMAFREKTNDPIIIYTGYYRSELETQIQLLQHFPNIIIKFGRYIPHQAPHHDDLLGVDLASDNQYAEQIS